MQWFQSLANKTLKTETWVVQSETERQVTLQYLLPYESLNVNKQSEYMDLNKVKLLQIQHGNLKLTTTRIYAVYTQNWIKVYQNFAPNLIT